MAELHNQKYGAAARTYADALRLRRGKPYNLEGEKWWSGGSQLHDDHVVSTDVTVFLCLAVRLSICDGTDGVR